MRRACLLLGLVGLLAGAPLSAAPLPAPPDALARAELLLEAAGLTEDATERFRLADEAAALCEKAAGERPADVEPLFRLVQALTITDPGHPERCRPGRCEAALAQLERVRRRDPAALQASRLAAEEGIILSRMQRFKEALLAYDRGLPLVEAARRPNLLEDGARSVLLWSNSAETAMGLHRLDEAIRRYELAIEHAVYAGSEWTLAHYGLGVALDRDGQGERARRVIARALEHDPALAMLHGEGVFFEPPGDLAYYEGLAHEVAGDDALAAQAFGRYLAARPQSRDAGRARWHLRRLGAQAHPSTPLVQIGPPMLENGRRSGESIRGRAQLHVAELGLCYARLLRERPGLALEVHLALEISPTGGVSQRARVIYSSESALTLSRCVELSAENWRFPPLLGGAPETVLIPIAFRPSAAASR